MLNDLFTNSYVQELSIQDHCREINIIYDEVRKAKNSGNTELKEILSSKLKGEEMDLLLILLEHFRINLFDDNEADIVTNGLYSARKLKFKEKESSK